MVVVSVMVGILHFLSHQVITTLETDTNHICPEAQRGCIICPRLQIIRVREIFKCFHIHMYKLKQFDSINTV